MTGKLDIHKRKINLKAYLTPCTKVILKGMIDLNEKLKLCHLKKKKKLNCCYIGLAKISETNTEHNF